MRIDVLVPIEDKKEDLRVKFDVAQIHHLIKYIADEGFDVDLQRKCRDPDRPKGIHRYVSQVVVKLDTPNKKGQAQQTL